MRKARNCEQSIILPKGTFRSVEDCHSLRPDDLPQFSLITTCGFDLAKESILPLFSLAKQSSCYQPSSTAPSIFLLMQGMLFTCIQLDDFQPTIAYFKECLQLEPLEVTKGEWVMMAMLNITSLVGYGKPGGALRKVCRWSSAVSVSIFPLLLIFSLHPVGLSLV